MIKTSLAITRAGALCLALGACSTLNPAINSVKSIDATKPQALVTDATLRATYLFPKDAAPKFCPEPPPDAATQLASKLSLKGGDGTVSAEAALDYNTAIVQLAGRTQTVLLARDLMFNACVLHANGAIDNAQIFALYNKTIDLIAQIAKADQLQSAAAAAKQGVSSDTIDGIIKFSPDRDAAVAKIVAFLQPKSAKDRGDFLDQAFKDSKALLNSEKAGIVSAADEAALTIKVGALRNAQLDTLTAAIANASKGK